MALFWAPSNQRGLEPRIHHLPPRPAAHRAVGRVGPHQKALLLASVAGGLTTFLPVVVGGSGGSTAHRSSFGGGGEAEEPLLHGSELLPAHLLAVVPDLLGCLGHDPPLLHGPILLRLFPASPFARRCCGGCFRCVCKGATEFVKACLQDAAHQWFHVLLGQPLTRRREHAQPHQRAMLGQRRDEFRGVGVQASTDRALPRRMRLADGVGRLAREIAPRGCRLVVSNPLCRGGRRRGRLHRRNRFQVGLCRCDLLGAH
mmetsp:Transcript_42162/g.106133  ORF Transcript_42162/g.106133 Transcript_42162/m.106133 type:complete len:258 (+) Transcript_42162:295-1068(+)